VQAPTFVPVVVSPGIVNWIVNTLSPAAASPLSPSSCSAALAPCPKTLRSQLTVVPVLAGFVPGVTVPVTVSSVPGEPDAGFAAIARVGGVETASATVVKLQLGLPTRVSGGSSVS
jgi:hypothetical protein